MPPSRARRMAASESLSSCEPQAYCQLPPPIAQAPKPIGVRWRSELPSCLVWLSVCVAVLISNLDAATVRSTTGYLRLQRHQFDCASHRNDENQREWRLGSQYGSSSEHRGTPPACSDRGCGLWRHPCSAGFREG